MHGPSIYIRTLVLAAATLAILGLVADSQARAPAKRANGKKPAPAQVRKVAQGKKAQAPAKRANGKKPASTLVRKGTQGKQVRAPLRRPSNNNRAMTRARQGVRRNSAAMSHREVAALRTAHQLLAKAKHDYDGHRVKAMHEITQAIHALSNQGNTANGKTGSKGGGIATKTGGAGAAGKENQVQSDALLRQAHQVLQTVHGQMVAAHHARAKGYVQAAIQNLNTALKIR